MQQAPEVLSTRDIYKGKIFQEFTCEEKDDSNAEVIIIF